MGLQTVTSIGTYKADNDNGSSVSSTVFKIFVSPGHTLNFSESKKLKTAMLHFHFSALENSEDFN